MSKTKSNVGSVLFLLLLALLFFGGIGGGLWYWYILSREAFLKDFAALPVFDEEAEARAIAESCHWDYPLKPPAVSREEFQRRMELMISAKMSQAFPPEELSGKIMKIINQYKAASPGDKVRFQLEPTAELIEGTFRKTDGLIVEVYVNNALKRYPCTRIMKHFYYLFSEPDSQKLQQNKIRELKKEYQERQEKYLEKIKPAVAMKLRPLGYDVKPDGKIVPAREAIEKQLETRRSEYDQQRKKDILKLIEKHRFLWMIEFVPPQEETVSPDRENGKEHGNENEHGNEKALKDESAEIPSPETVQSSGAAGNLAGESQEGKRAPRPEVIISNPQEAGNSAGIEGKKGIRKGEDL